MAGFGLRGIKGRIPCPHCYGTDCAGLGPVAKDGQRPLMCCLTEKKVTEYQLKTSAIVEAMKSDSPYIIKD